MKYPKKTRDFSWAQTYVYLAAGFVLASVILLVVMIVVFAGPALFEQGNLGIFTWHWNPYQGLFGILPMVMGSIILSFSALFLALPLAISLCSLMLTAPKHLAVKVLQAAIRFMTAIPTVVYAFVGVLLLTPLVRLTFAGSGLSLLTATLVLALLIMPTMVLVLNSGLGAKLDELCPHGLAIGLDKFELLWFFVFPRSKKTFLAAGLLGFGRAVGDTLIPLMLAGNAPQVPQGLGQSLRTLSAHMALVTANEVGGAAYSSLFMAGFLLLGISALVSIISRALVKN